MYNIHLWGDVMKNLKINRRFAALALTGTITLSTLTGCGNYTMVDTKFTYNKAIIFSENTATIVEIKKWADYDGEQIQLETTDGLFILTSSFDTKLIDDRNSDTKAEDVIRAIKGDEVVITYLGKSNQKTK